MWLFPCPTPLICVPSLASVMAKRRPLGFLGPVISVWFRHACQKKTENCDDIIWNGFFWRPSSIVCRISKQIPETDVLVCISFVDDGSCHLGKPVRACSSTQNATTKSPPFALWRAGNKGQMMSKMDFRASCFTLWQSPSTVCATRCLSLVDLYDACDMCYASKRASERACVHWKSTTRRNNCQHFWCWSANDVNKPNIDVCALSGSAECFQRSEPLRRSCLHRALSAAEWLLACPVIPSQRIPGQQQDGNMVTCLGPEKRSLEGAWNGWDYGIVLSNLCEQTLNFCLIGVGLWRLTH